MQNVLVLCIGNICRSPIAEALLRQQFPDKTISSAGLGALLGYPADPLSIEVSAEQGVDLSAHRARQLSSWMCQAADMILVMEQRHKVEVEQLHPLVRGKVFRLGELGKFDIEDPHRKPREAFDTAYAHIARGVADWVPRIRLLD